MFDNIPFVGPITEEGDELKRYLASDPVPVEDPIQWWQDRRKAYPRLSRMAIDYLTIPGESTSLVHIPALCSHLRQRRLSTSNASSAVAGSSCLTSATG